MSRCCSLGKPINGGLPRRELKKPYFTLRQFYELVPVPLVDHIILWIFLLYYIMPSAFYARYVPPVVDRIDDEPATKRRKASKPKKNIKKLESRLSDADSDEISKHDKIKSKYKKSLDNSWSLCHKPKTLLNKLLSPDS